MLKSVIALAAYLRMVTPYYVIQSSRRSAVNVSWTDGSIVRVIYSTHVGFKESWTVNKHAAPISSPVPRSPPLTFLHRCNFKNLTAKNIFSSPSHAFATPLKYLSPRSVNLTFRDCVEFFKNTLAQRGKISFSKLGRDAENRILWKV